MNWWSIPQFSLHFIWSGLVIFHCTVKRCFVFTSLKPETQQVWLKVVLGDNLHKETKLKSCDTFSALWFDERLFDTERCTVQPKSYENFTTVPLFQVEVQVEQGIRLVDIDLLELKILALWEHSNLEYWRWSSLNAIRNCFDHDTLQTIMQRWENVRQVIGQKTSDGDGRRLTTTDGDDLRRQLIMRTDNKPWKVVWKIVYFWRKWVRACT